MSGNSGKEEVKEQWKSHFQCLMNDKTEREAIVRHGCASGWKV